MADMKQSWKCPDCGEVRHSPYCPQCGEELLRPDDLTLSDLAVKLGQSVSSMDGKAVKTFRTLLLAPGKLTIAYLEGKRRAFINPLELFLITNALFFAAQSSTQTNILSSTLQSHLTKQDWKSVAKPMVAAHLKESHQSFAQYAPVFDTAVVLYAKSLIILMALALAPVLALIFWRSRRVVGGHIVFALHLYAFVLLLFCVSLGITELDLLRGGIGLASPRIDIALSLFNLAACLAYLYVAIGHAYGVRGLRRIIAAIFLTACVAGIVVGYRFLMFIVTLSWT